MQRNTISARRHTCIQRLSPFSACPHAVCLFSVCGEADRGCRYIVTVRRPIDVLVSYYRFYLQRGVIPADTTLEARPRGILMGFHDLFCLAITKQLLYSEVIHCSSGEHTAQCACLGATPLCERPDAAPPQRIDCDCLLAALLLRHRRVHNTISLSSLISLAGLGAAMEHGGDVAWFGLGLLRRVLAVPPPARGAPRVVRASEGAP